MRLHNHVIARCLGMLAAIMVASDAGAQFFQQSAKLVGTGAAGTALQGNAVALSADGNTAVVGGSADNDYLGATWVFTRAGGVWSQQGDKLVGSDALFNGLQGWSVAVSADGNTAVVCGDTDQQNGTAAWAFTRSGGTWAQQGAKLVGAGGVGRAREGYVISHCFVAISGVGDTLILGAHPDNADTGAAWVFTRSGGVWTQQGAKLVGTGAANSPYGARQGHSVALSADGNTALIGGGGDDGARGATWVFTRSGGVWTQQGAKLVGTGGAGSISNQGLSVALSADGNTAVVGAPGDDANDGAVGATWVFARSGGVWTQQGAKLVGTGAVGPRLPQQGTSVSVTADGNTAIVGGPYDNGIAGAAWVFKRSGGVWSQAGAKLVGAGAVNTPFPAVQGRSVAISADGGTALVGGFQDNGNVGAAWVFTATNPDIGVSAPALAFGGQSMGTTSASQAVTVTNTAGATLTVNAVAVSNAQFSQIHDCGSLAPAASCTVTVSFSPAASPGALNASVAVAGTLSIASNGGPVTVGLGGTAERSLVTHYYRSILRRAPDGAGKVFWEGEAARVAGLGANVNEVWYSMAMSFYFSAEYAILNRNNSDFLTDLYNTFFNRTPDTAGFDFWTTRMDGGMPREGVLANFMFSPEFANFTQATFGNATARAEVNVVVDFYRGLLSRLPDSGGYNFYVQRFRAAQCQNAGAVYTQAENISQGFATSPEYANRGRSSAQYVADLYNSFLRRGPDLAGVQFWLGQLNGGRSRESLRQEFKVSPEFNLRVNNIIAQGCF